MKFKFKTTEPVRIEENKLQQIKMPAYETIPVSERLLCQKGYSQLRARLCGPNSVEGVVQLVTSERKNSKS